MPVHRILIAILSVVFVVAAEPAHAILNVATTTLFISICGDEIVSQGEDCDVPGEIGTYSTTIIGRQCSAHCKWGPYCGDTILQTLHGEQCDDGNNVSGDFCSADCKTEKSDFGGGESGGGGNSARGGSSVPLGDTQVSINGLAYANATVHILIDATEVGTVRTNSRGEFTFTTDTEPGTASFGFWSTDSTGTRSLTVNTTFDVTQGAVTNLNGILLPPTIRTVNAQVNPGDQVTLAGQTIPNANVEISIDGKTPTLRSTADGNGNWSVIFDTRTVSIDTHTAKARFVTGTGSLRTESTYGTALSLFVGVEGKATVSSDLNRDGKVNLIDFSILAFWWGTPGGNSNPPADINQNGRVGLEDFSILLFNWTG